MAIIKCPECDKTVSDMAGACPGCGHPLQRQAPEKPEEFVLIQDWHPAVAALLSFFIPGVGQMYKGRIMEGICWLIFVVIGYLLFYVPGVILHIFCIINAASGHHTKVRRV